VLNPLSPVEAMELLLGRLVKSKSNGEFLASMSSQRKPANDRDAYHSLLHSAQKTSTPDKIVCG